MLRLILDNGQKQLSFPEDKNITKPTKKPKATGTVTSVSFLRKYH